MDTFGFTASPALHAEYPLLGKRLSVRTNSAAILQATERHFGHWCDLPVEACSDEHLRLDVIEMPSDRQHSATYRPQFVHRMNGRTLLAAADDTLMTAQLDHGYAIAFVSKALVANASWFDKHILDTLGLAVATQHEREPIHAGAVVRDGHAILLAGKSKAGKSTLCYACAQSGFDLLAEDVIYIQRQPDLRVWGNASHIHLLPDAPHFFAELAGLPATLQPSGKVKLATPIPNRQHFAERASLCLIERHEGAGSTIEPLATDEAQRCLFDGVDEGFDLYPNAREAARHMLACSRPGGCASGAIFPVRCKY